MRARPILPALEEDPIGSWMETDTGIRLPLYSCPFSGCCYSTDDRLDFLLHLGGRDGVSPHCAAIEDICGKDRAPRVSNLDFVSAAMTYMERQRWPRLGLSVTRRSLRTLAGQYNDRAVKCLVCFVCGEQRVTLAGPEHICYDAIGEVTKKCRKEIDMYGLPFFQKLEEDHPGSLLNNCSYALWYERYVARSRQREDDDVLVLLNQ